MCGFGDANFFPILLNLYFHVHHHCTYESAVRGGKDKPISVTPVTAVQQYSGSIKHHPFKISIIPHLEGDKRGVDRADDVQEAANHLGSRL